MSDDTFIVVELTESEIVTIEDSLYILESVPEWNGITVSSGAPIFVAHHHDERYYTETEIDALLAALSFLDLDDTPNSYVGHTLKMVRVNAAETGLEFITMPTPVVDHGALTGLLDDDHPQYQLRSEEGAPGGYASLDGGGTVPDAQIPAAITRDAELTAAIAAHEAAADPHPTYTTAAELAAAISVHEAAADPHPVYTTAAELAAAIAAHEAAADPHPTYLTLAEGNALYSLLGHTHDHGTLTGLGDDDHTQYLLANGTRALTADWDAGSFEIRAQTFESDVATGTAPFVVASTTLVANLNVDLLDGQSGAFYLDSANFTGTSWVDLTDGGSTTLHTHSHLNLTDIGTNSHAAIDAHIASTANPHSTTLKQAYDASTGAPVIIGLTATDGGIVIRDASTPIGATLFGVQTNGGTSFFDVNATRIQAGVDIDALTDNTQDIGNVSTNRFRSVNGRLGIFVGGTTTPTISAPLSPGNEGGLIAGSQNTLGTRAHTLDANNPDFPAVAVIGNVYNSYSSGTAQMQNYGGGAFMGGSAFTIAPSLTARLRTTQYGYGSFVWGYCVAYGGNSYITCEAQGAFCGGYPVGVTGGASTVRAHLGAQGAFVWGRAPVAGAGTRRVYARGAGSFVAGIADSTNASAVSLIESGASGTGGFVQGSVNVTAALTGTLTASAAGAFAQGRVNATSATATIIASGAGAFAQGQTTNAVLTASGAGSFAHGNAVTNAITASGAGSFAAGDSTTAAITATATNAFQFGPGANATASTVQIGNGGLRLKQTTGAPGTLQNGDIWVANNYVYIRSNATTCRVTNAVL